MRSVTLPDDVLAHFDCGFVLPFRDKLEVVGDDGSLHIEDPWHIGKVCAAICGTAPPLHGHADAVGQARTLDALYRSAATAAPVPAVDWSAR
jgi:xylose dehydrogenase (NAD/NADP)